MSTLPFAGSGWNEPVLVEGSQAIVDGDLPQTDILVATPGYFRTMGIRLVRGRDFEDQDNDNAPKRAIINQTFADIHWPNEDPIGKVFSLRDESFKKEVIGVVSDVSRHGLDKETTPCVYLAFSQQIIPVWNLVVQTTLEDSSQLIRGLKDTVSQIASGYQPITRVVTMEEFRSDSISQARFQALLVAAFGIAALTLASIGLYGVMSYMVTQRTHEIGIRMALGSQPGRVHRLVVGGAMRLTLIGIVIGIISLFAMSKLVSNQMYGIGVADPVFIVGVACLLLFVSLVACAIPSVRAVRISPMTAFRTE